MHALRDFGSLPYESQGLPPEPFGNFGTSKFEALRIRFDQHQTGTKASLDSQIELTEMEIASLVARLAARIQALREVAERVDEKHGSMIQNLQDDESSKSQQLDGLLGEMLAMVNDEQRGTHNQIYERKRSEVNSQRIAADSTLEELLQGLQQELTDSALRCAAQIVYSSVRSSCNEQVIKLS